MDCLSAALRYAGRGWRVFPLNGKRPFKGTRGHLDATTDPKEIRKWFKRWPDANVGIACDSRSGPIVVDVDGPSGAALLATIDVPETREASSGRPDRKHLFFDPMFDGTIIRRTIKIQKQSLDILGDGGYVVAPPSIHPETGKPYRWTQRIPLAPFPKSILALIPDRPRAAAPPLPESLGEGERDELLTSLAGSMRRRGASELAILSALREENASRCNPPLPDSQLKKIARSIGKKEPAARSEHMTDLGNARRFITQHERDVRAVTSMRRPWYVWEGPRWIQDDTGEIERRAKATVRAIYDEAGRMPDEETRDALLKHAAKSESASRIRGMLELAATEPEINLTPDQLDQNDWLFNVENGTINLKTGELQPHRRKDLITKLAPVEYDPEAAAPRWEQFLHEIMCGDDELVRFLQSAIGYTMTGNVGEECLFFCYGKGANGKSTLLEILRRVFGDYGQQADFRTFLTRRSEGPRDDLAGMHGARFIAASEADDQYGFDSTILKQLTGADTIRARHLYERSFEFKPKHKLWLAANHKPIVKEQTVAFWRRMRLIPFVATFTANQRDRGLRETLEKELPGILRWAVAGALQWQREGLKEPRAVRRATSAYREENDLLGEFFSAHCELIPNAWSATTQLYRAFTEWWLDTRGPRSAPVSLSWFSRMLSERDGLRQVKQGGLRGWTGVSVKITPPR